MTDSWQEIAAVQPGRSRLVPSTWPYDKYPNAPELDAGKTVTLIDQDGPGVITCLHVSNYYNKVDFGPTGGGAQALMLRVWYDHHPAPSIEMLLMDFLGDVNAESGYFSTIYFSKVKQSHNFRLPMPFRRHIRITVENTSAVNLIGYTDVQWEQVTELPAACGVLRAQYCAGLMRVPQEPATLWDLRGRGNVVAHWLQFESDDPLCPRGELLCEGNQEITLDGDSAPTLEYLGTEDLYGFSWGFQDLQSDGRVAILKREELPGGGARIAMLRTRAADRIRFERACRLVLNYQHDAACKINPRVRQAEEKGGILAPFRSCVYYYSLDEESQS
jgi:hypothetical protein